MTKQHILSEIKRTAETNGSVPLGSQRFATETGITETDWKGKFWARWSDALQEAGFEPNKMVQGYDHSDLLDRYAKLALDVRRLPTDHDIRLRIRKGLEFPRWSTFNTQFGSKSQFIEKLREYCQLHAGFEPVLVMCNNYAPSNPKSASDPAPTEVGYVYLLKHGSRREYKIGRTNNRLRREGEIGLELPEKIDPIHYIETDDPAGIEAYWHRRFADKRLNGEFFNLTADDVRAFKRWRHIY